MISAGITMGNDSAANISKVFKNVTRSRPHSLNKSSRSALQKVSFFIPRQYAEKPRLNGKKGIPHFLFSAGSLDLQPFLANRIVSTQGIGRAVEHHATMTHDQTAV